MARQAGAMEDPDQAALGARLLDAFHHLALGGAVERRRRLVEDDDVRPLQQGAGDRGLLLLRYRQARAAAADAEFEADADDRLAQAERVEHLGDDGGNPRRRRGLAIGDLAEEDVVLQRGGGVVTVNVEELDLRAHRRRQIVGEDLAGGEDARLERFVEQTETMTGDDHLEGQREQLAAILRFQRVAAGLVDAAEDGLELRQGAGADEAVLLEELVLGRQIGEQFDHRLRHLLAHGDEIVGQPDLVEDAQDIGVLGEEIEIEGGSDRRAEQQVLGERGVGVVALGVVALDEMGDALLGEAAGERVARLDHALGDVGPLLQIEPAAQPEGIDVLVEIDPPEDLDRAHDKLRRILGPGRFVIDPVGAGVEVGIAGLPRLLERNRHRLGAQRLVVALADRPVLQAEIKIVLQRAGEEMRRRAGIADAAADNSIVQGGDIDAADGDAAAGRLDEPGEQQAELMLAARALPDDGDMGVRREGEAHRVDDARPLVLGEAEIGGADLAGERRDLVRRIELPAIVDHALGLELLDDLLVLDLGVLQELVEIEQLGPRRGEVLVGGEDGDQGAEREIALDHQIAADRIEEERRQLGDEVVEELDEELAAIDLEADVVDGAEKAGEIGELPADRVVGVDLGDAGRRIADAVGDQAHGAHALLAEEIDLALQLGDEIALQRVERDRGGAEHRVLHEHEDDD